MIYTAFIETPIGCMGLKEEDGYLIQSFYVQKNPDNQQQTFTPLLQKAMDQLQEYFVGTRDRFDIPLRFEGTNFQKQVWQELQRIPYGETRTYGEIATYMDKPHAARAVGQANNKNPLMIFIPCHRVIGAKGALVGYANGLGMKKTLLDLENANCGVKLSI